MTGSIDDGPGWQRRPLRLAAWALAARALAMIATIMVLAGCAGGDAPLDTAQNVTDIADYRLGPGDHLRIIVFGEDQLSGEFTVDGSGTIAMPLIGEIKAADGTARTLEQKIAKELAKGYVNDARVSVQVTSFRPFYIIGEVNQPGQYSYVNGMTAVTAVALARGYTYRGRQDYVLITRGSDPSKTERRAPVNTPVMPDDVVRVPERFF